MPDKTAKPSRLSRRRVQAALKPVIAQALKDAGCNENDPDQELRVVRALLREAAERCLRIGATPEGYAHLAGDAVTKALKDDPLFITAKQMGVPIAKA